MARHHRIANVPRNWKTVLKEHGETWYILRHERIAEVRVAPRDGGFLVLHPGVKTVRRRQAGRAQVQSHPIWVTAQQLRGLCVRKTRKAAIKAGMARCRRVLRLFERRVIVMRKDIEKLEAKLAKEACVRPPKRKTRTR